MQRHPVTVTKPTAEQLREAQEWIWDSFEDAPADLTTAEIVRGISRHYAGGWSAFLAHH